MNTVRLNRYPGMRRQQGRAARLKSARRRPRAIKDCLSFGGALLHGWYSPASRSTSRTSQPAISFASEPIRPWTPAPAECRG
jgi:hypothetical protein